MPRSLEARVAKEVVNIKARKERALELLEGCMARGNHRGNKVKSRERFENTGKHFSSETWLKQQTKWVSEKTWVMCKFGHWQQCVKMIQKL